MDPIEFQQAGQGNIMQAMIAAAKEIDTLTKDGKMGGAAGGYSYASEKAYKELCRDILLKNGLWLMGPRVVEQTVRAEQSRGDNFIYKAYVVIECHLAHISGAIWPFPFSAAGEGSDTLDKAINKAHTSANKNLLDKLFQIPTEKDAETGAAGGTTPPARVSAPTGGAPAAAPAAGGSNPPARGAAPVNTGPSSAPGDPNAVFNPAQTTGDEYVWLEILKGTYFDPKGQQTEGSVSWLMKDPENGATAFVGMKWSLAQGQLDMDDPRHAKGRYLCQVRSREWNDKTYWDCDNIMSPAQAQARQGGPVAGAYVPGAGDFEDEGNLNPPIPADDPRGPASTPGD